MHTTSAFDLESSKTEIKHYNTPAFHLEEILLSAQGPTQVAQVAQTAQVSWLSRG
jgi:hypothetical protein